MAWCRVSTRPFFNPTLAHHRLQCVNIMCYQRLFFGYHRSHICLITRFTLNLSKFMVINMSFSVYYFVLKLHEMPPNCIKFLKKIPGVTPPDPPLGSPLWGSQRACGTQKRSKFNMGPPNNFQPATALYWRQCLCHRLSKKCFLQILILQMEYATGHSQLKHIFL